MAKPTITPTDLELAQRHIVLGLTGGIACYKTAELCRLLIKAGASVQVMMTESASQFIGTATMQALSGQAVVTNQWQEHSHYQMPHIHMSRAADAMVLAPCSANCMARLAQGMADDIVTLTALARPPHVPLLIAPAMNREMYVHPATQRNVQQLADDGAQVLQAGCGEQACGEFGDGRMLEPDAIYDHICAALTPKTLAGQAVLITAGATFEAIDPVRGITNRSSGKMGFALARAAHQAGAQVTLIAGNVHLPTPTGVMRVDVESAQEMLNATQQHIPQHGIFIATAAVADWRVAQTAEHKIKKKDSDTPPTLAFVENPDILATIAHSAAAKKGDVFCVGFAAESENLLANAQAKRQRKNVPLLVANIGSNTFGKDYNAVLLVDAAGSVEYPQTSKRQLAQQLIQAIAQRLPQ